MDSKLFTLGLKDLLHGLLVAVFASVLACIKTSLEAGNFNLDIKQIGTAAILGGGAYLLKKFTSNDNGQLLTRNRFLND
jgi:hypothetical protein